MYEKKFIEAVHRTERFGLSMPVFSEPCQHRYLTEKAQYDLASVIHNSLGLLSPEEVVLQCLQLNMRLKTVFSQYFKTPVYYTIGYVGLDENFMFEQTEESLQAMLRNGIEGPSVNLHAWITLPSMEIMDFSLPTTFGKLKGIESMVGTALALHPSELTGGMTYHPMLIGEEFLLKIGAMNLYVDIGM